MVTTVKKNYPKCYSHDHYLEKQAHKALGSKTISYKHVNWILIQIINIVAANRKYLVSIYYSKKTSWKMARPQEPGDGSNVLLKKTDA